MLSREKKFLSRSTTRRKIVPLSFGCSLFHWPICTHGSSLPFYIASRTTPKNYRMDKPESIAKMKMKSNRREKGKEKKIRPVIFLANLLLARRWFVDRESRDLIKKKNCWLFPPTRSSVGKWVENVIASVGSEGGELRKKTWFFNLPVARTWLHAYVCKAGECGEES